MENKTHRFISTKYELYSMEYGNEVLIEKTEENRPLTFYTGCEMALPQFEEIAIKTLVGEDFSFDLAKGEAYGDYNEENVLDLNKEVFSQGGEFDSSNVYIGATIPLQNQEGQRFIARVIDITEDKVKVDLNHPLAGKELRFKGHIIENREATDEEIKEFLRSLIATIATDIVVATKEKETKITNAAVTEVTKAMAKAAVVVATKTQKIL